jgi:hypothetical protein
MDKIYDKHYEVWKPENATESGVFGNFEFDAFAVAQIFWVKAHKVPKGELTITRSV